jgi:hypothetical protein
MMPGGPAHDPRLVWQNQGKEHPVMSIEDVRSKARIVHTKIRRNLIAAFGLGLLLLVFCIFVIATNRNLPLRILTATLMAQTIAIVYTAHSRSWSIQTLAANTALSGCLDFYRKELKAQYRSLSLTWCFLVPIVIFVFLTWGSFFVGGGIFRRTVLPAALIGILLFRRYQVRKLRQRLSVLDEFETEAKE